MSSSRPRLRRYGLLGAVAALLSVAFAVPTAAADVSITGSLTYLERVALSPEAVAIVTIVDTTASPDAGAVIGQQRIDAPTGVPIDFSVAVDQDTIDQTHAYALFATISDGSTVWQNRFGEPVITGGPTNAIDLTLPMVAPDPAATVAGTIVPPDGTVLDTSAVAIAALIKVDTGTLIARQVRPVTDAADLSFSIGIEPALIDPTSSYVVKGGIVDGASVWQNRDGVAAIDGGTVAPAISLPVTLAPTGLPGASPLPTPPPSSAPTVPPTAEPSPAQEHRPPRPRNRQPPRPRPQPRPRPRRRPRPPPRRPFRPQPHRGLPRPRPSPGR